MSGINRKISVRGRVGAALAVVGVVALGGVVAGVPFSASADSSYACPSGTYEGLRYNYDPAVSSVAVGNWPAVYVGVGLVGGGHVQYGNGVDTMNNAVLNVFADHGANATDAHICKVDPNATTTTTEPEVTTTTTTEPEVTTTTTTEPDVTTTTEVDSGGPTTTTTEPDGTTTTEVASGGPTTTTPEPGPTNPVTELPATGGQQTRGMVATAALMLIGGALLMCGARRRVPTAD